MALKIASLNRRELLGFVAAAAMLSGNHFLGECIDQFGESLMHKLAIL